MKKIRLATAVLAVAWPSLASAGMVSARWGVKGRLAHPGTVRFAPAGDGATAMVVDLSALPAGAAIHRARLRISGMKWKDVSFEIVPADRAGTELRPAGKPLTCPGPYYQWLDATEAVRGWAKAGRKTGLLWLRRAPEFEREATALEISYEGPPRGRLAPQVSDVRALYRNGQVFVSFREIDPPDGGKEEVTWGDLTGKMKADYYGPVAADGERELRYRVYRHDRPIAPATIGSAELLGEVLPGSGINTRVPLVERRGKWQVVEGLLGRSKKQAGARALRLAAEPGRCVPPGHGLYVHTVRRTGKAYYAVLTAVDGEVNGVDVSSANATGPVEQRVVDPEPVLFKELVWKRRDGEFVEQWFSFWTVPPLSPWPARYDVVVGFPRPLPTEAPPLSINKEGWNSFAHPPSPERQTGIYMSHTSDQPIEFRCGMHDSIRTIKGFDRGRWQPFHGRRQDAIVKWVCARWRVDRRRISVNMGAWGWHELTRGSTYAHVHGWVQPELTKGFLSWDWARSVWGGPAMYEGRPDAEDPWRASSATAWILAHPEVEMPFLQFRTGVGAHLTEMGWPPFPKCFWALMKTKRAFTYCPRGPVKEALADGQIVLRSNQSMPAFAHCSLDDNPGEGDLRSGDGFGGLQINGYLLWDTESILDEPKRWEMTLYLPDEAPLGECTVDMTPRNCQRFKAGPGRTCAWSNALLPGGEGGGTGRADRARVVQHGVVTSDKYGLVTIKDLRIGRRRHRIAVWPQ